MRFNGQHAVIIPAYKPADSMLTLIEELKMHGVGAMIVVDDGSGEEYAPLFKAAREGGATVLCHAVNMGKGRALKTAFNHILSAMPHITGAVMADADGQHACTDIVACAERLLESPDALIMGCRQFDESIVPFKSRFGNKLTRTAMKVLCGVTVSDTQTGLRALGTGFMRRLLTLSGERYEFETNMLLETRRAGIAIVEVPIATIYIDNNAASHFNPLRDSLRIYGLLFKFVASSLASSIVDIVMFSVFVAILRPFALSNYIVFATVAARVISALFNYFVNSNLVFESSDATHKTMLKYFALCAVQMAASALLVTAIFSVLPYSEVGVKIVVDMVLFLISFQIQNRFIFR